MRAGSLLGFLLSLSCAAAAAPPVPTTLEEAGAQRERAASLRADAERSLEAE